MTEGVLAGQRNQLADTGYDEDVTQFMELCNTLSKSSSAGAAIALWWAI